MQIEHVADLAGINFSIFEKVFAVLHVNCEIHAKSRHCERNYIFLDCSNMRLCVHNAYFCVIVHILNTYEY